MELKKRKLQNSKKVSVDLILKPISENSSGIPSSVKEIFKVYADDKNKAMAIFVEMVVNICGHTAPIDPHHLSDRDTINDMVERIVRSYDTSHASASLLLYGNKGKPTGRAHGRGSDAPDGTCRNYRNFMKRWTAHALTLWVNEHDKYPLTIAISVLTPLSAVAVRALRHASTLALLTFTEALCEKAQHLQRDVSLATQQLEGLDKGPIKEQVADQRQNLKEIVQEIESMMEMVFNSVFMHRYRDVVDSIRARCMSSLGEWITSYPDAFLSNTHVRYLGWMLSDKSAEVRAATLNAMLDIYSDHERATSLQAFTERFRERLLEVTLWDTDERCRLGGLKVLEKMAYAGLLEGSDLEKLFLLLVVAEDDACDILTALIAHYITEETEDLALSTEETLKRYAGIQTILRVHAAIERQLCEQQVSIARHMMPEIHYKPPLEANDGPINFSLSDVCKSFGDSYRQRCLPDDSFALCQQLFDKFRGKHSYLEDWETMCSYLKTGKVPAEQVPHLVQWIAASASHDGERDDAKMSALVTISNTIQEEYGSVLDKQAWLAMFHFAQQIGKHVWQKNVFAMSVKRIGDAWLSFCDDQYTLLQPLTKLLNEKVPSLAKQYMENMLDSATALADKRDGHSLPSLCIKLYTLFKHGDRLFTQQVLGSLWELGCNCVELGLGMLEPGDSVENVAGNFTLTQSLDILLMLSFESGSTPPLPIFEKLEHVRGIAQGILRDGSNKFSAPLKLKCVQLISDSLLIGDSTVLTVATVEACAAFVCQLARTLSGYTVTTLPPASAAELVDLEAVGQASYTRVEFVRTLIAVGKLAILNRNGASAAFALLASQLFSGKSPTALGSGILVYSLSGTSSRPRGVCIYGNDVDQAIKFVLWEVLDKGFARSLGGNESEQLHAFLLTSSEMIVGIFSELVKQVIPVSAGVILAREFGKIMKSWALYLPRGNDAVTVWLTGLIEALLSVVIASVTRWKQASVARSGLYVELDAVNSNWKLLTPVIPHLQGLVYKMDSAQPWSGASTIKSFTFAQLEKVHVYPEAKHKAWDSFYVFMKSLVNQ